MSHLKRYVMPNWWPLAVKEETFVIRPSPGPHPMNRCIPLQVIIRNVLGLAETASEARRILNAGKVLVDKSVRRSPKFPVGLLDIIEIPDIGKHYRMGISRKGLSLEDIDASDTGKKLCMITGKRTLKGGAKQLNLHDGRNIIIGKGKDEYNVRDTVMISLPEQKIVKHYKLEKGSPAFIFSGKNMGVSGTIKEVKVRKSMTEKSTVIIKSESGETETLMDYIFVGDAGAAKPAKAKK